MGFFVGSVRKMILRLEQEQQTPLRVDTPVFAEAPYCTWSTISWMVLIAFAVRVSFLLLLGTYRFDRADDDGIGEINYIAAPIGKGLGINSPFSNEHTGPTSWIAPVQS